MRNSGSLVIFETEREITSAIYIVDGWFTFSRFFLRRKLVVFFVGTQGRIPPSDD